MIRLCGAIRLARRCRQLLPHQWRFRSLCLSMATSARFPGLAAVIEQAIALQQNRRRSTRHQYPDRLLIAFHSAPTVPRRRDFIEVEGCDLSVGGFSFLVSELPIAKLIVVALGRENSRIYVQAKILRFKRIERDGKPVFMVGCEFTESLERFAAQPPTK